MSKPRARVTAADLIKAKQPTEDMPSAEALGELRAVLAHNDQTRNPNTRVGAEQVCEMLAGYGWRGGRTKLDRVCRALGRKSFGTP